MHEAKTQLSQLVRDLENGDEITITRSGKPVARLVPPTDAEPKRKFAETYGMLKGQVWMSDDFDDDDDEMARLFGIID